MASGFSKAPMHIGELQQNTLNRAQKEAQKALQDRSILNHEAAYEDDDNEVGNIFSGQHQTQYRDPYSSSKRSARAPSRAPSARLAFNPDQDTHSGRAPSIGSHSRRPGSGKALPLEVYEVDGGRGKGRDYYGGRAPIIRPPGKRVHQGGKAIARGNHP